MRKNVKIQVKRSRVKLAEVVIVDDKPTLQDIDTIVIYGEYSPRKLKSEMKKRGLTSDKIIPVGNSITEEIVFSMPVDKFMELAEELTKEEYETRLLEGTKTEEIK